MSKLFNEALFSSPAFFDQQCYVKTISLSAHLLQVTAIEGPLEEVVPLLSVIPASPRPQNWLSMLEEKMRNTLVQCLAECVERRLQGRESPCKLVELMTALGMNLYLASFLAQILRRPSLECTT